MNNLIVIILEKILGPSFTVGPRQLPRERAVSNEIYTFIEIVSHLLQ